VAQKYLVPANRTVITVLPPTVVSAAEAAAPASVLD
jgi:hypothetical protein